MQLSERQREVLRILGEDGAPGWGEVWTHYDENGRPNDFYNFGRVVDALKRKGLVREDPETGWISTVTD